MMITLTVILFIMMAFVLTMNRRPDIWYALTHWLRIRTSMLRPEVSIVEMIILLLLAVIVFKLYL